MPKRWRRGDRASMSHWSVCDTRQMLGVSTMGSMQLEACYPHPALYRSPIRTWPGPESWLCITSMTAFIDTHLHRLGALSPSLLCLGVAGHLPAFRLLQVLHWSLCMACMTRLSPSSPTSIPQESCPSPLPCMLQATSRPSGCCRRCTAAKRPYHPPTQPPASTTGPTWCVMQAA